MLTARFLLTLTLGLSAACVAHADPIPITAPLSWSESAGGGACRFQGTVDGTDLKGSVYADGLEFAVLGTVASDGAVSGTMRTLGGTTIGTFGATLADDQLTGGYFVLNGSPGSWSAPAEELPIPNG